MAFRHKHTKMPYLSVQFTEGSHLAKVTTTGTPEGYIVRADNIEEYKDGRVNNAITHYPVPEPRNDGSSFLREQWVTITTTNKRWLEQMIKEREARIPTIPNEQTRQVEVDYVAALKHRLEELNGTA